MGNTHTALEDDEATSGAFIDQKGSSRHKSASIGDLSKIKSSVKPSRITRHVTHTTNVTYDDSLSLSTCATNSMLNKSSNVHSQHSPMFDNNIDDIKYSESPIYQENDDQRKYQIQRKMKLQQQQTKTALMAKIHVSNYSESSDIEHIRPTRPQHSEQEQERVVGVMYAAPNRNVQTYNIEQSQRTLPSVQYSDGRITEQDQWQNAWEDDTESSDEEDNSIKNLSLKENLDCKRSGSQSPKRDRKSLEEAKQVGVINWDKCGIEKPNIMMFFPLLRVLGKGSFGKVVLVQKRCGKEKGGLFAMKMLRKTHLYKRGQIERTRTERKVLAMVDHPFIMKLHFAFQNDEKLFLVLDYCAGGELFFHLSRHQRFSEQWTRFYTAELLLAFGHLHSHGIIYRDLKPENVLLDSDGHVKLGDFGLAKTGIKHPCQGAKSRVGTPEYMAPEILQQKGHGFCVDYWGLGMLTYEMMTGLPPWYTTDRNKLLKRLAYAPLDIPTSFSSQLASFITGVLNRDPKLRLGVHGHQSVISHAFFRRLDFKALYRREIDAPILPCEGWKAPKPFIEKNSKARKSLIRGMFGNTSNNQMLNQLPSDELDAATVNFDKQFTRMALSSVSGNGEEVNSEKGDISQELNGNTFIGFTFDDDVKLDFDHT